MNNQEIQNELLQVQKEIAELPAGYLSKKDDINGKTKHIICNGRRTAKRKANMSMMRTCRRIAREDRAKTRASKDAKRNLLLCFPNRRKHEQAGRGNARFQNRRNARRKLEKLRSDSRKLQKEKSLT